MMARVSVYLAAVFSLLLTHAAAARVLTASIEPASATYDSAVEDIDLQVRLSVDSAATTSVTVCTFHGGVLQFAGVRANGVPLKPARFASQPFESFRLFQERSLVTLRPGESATMPLRLTRRSDASVELHESVVQPAGVYPENE